MFGQRRRLRHLAAQVLLMWLFALGASIVNACALEPELRHAVTAASHVSRLAADTTAACPARHDVTSATTATAFRIAGIVGRSRCPKTRTSVHSTGSSSLGCSAEHLGLEVVDLTNRGSRFARSA